MPGACHGGGLRRGMKENAEETAGYSMRDDPLEESPRESRPGPEQLTQDQQGRCYWKKTGLEPG